MTVRPYTQPEVFSLGFSSMKTHHLPLPAQLPDLNVIKPLWLAVESRGRSSLLRPSAVKQLEDVLHGERHSLKLESVQNWSESVARRIQAVLRVNGGLSTY
jgi:hypothetical protein